MEFDLCLLETIFDTLRFVSLLYLLTGRAEASVKLAGDTSIHNLAFTETSHLDILQNPSLGHFLPLARHGKINITKFLGCL